MSKQTMKLNRSVIEIWLASKTWASREEGIAAFVAMSRSERRSYAARCRKLAEGFRKRRAVVQKEKA